MALQVVDFNLVPLDFQAKIKETLEKESEILDKEYRLLNLRVHFTAHEKGGARKKYSLRFFADQAGKPVTISVFDWDPVLATNRGIKRLKTRLQKEKDAAFAEKTRNTKVLG